MEEMTDLPGAAEERSGRWSGALRSLVLPLGLLAVILGGLWYWSERGGARIDDAYGAVELPPDKNHTGAPPAPEVGRAGPDFELERPDGGTLRLSDYQGQPLLLNFWASWCAPCKAEMPELVDAYRTYSDAGLEIIAVNLQEPDEAVLDFANEYGITFPIAIDRDGELTQVWRLGGPVDGIPTSYFIDEQGIVRDLFYGPLTEDALEMRVETLLEETS